MGLDWTPLPRPQPGREKEFEKLFAALKAESGDREELIDQVQRISIEPAVTVGAPRVGFDSAADAYLRNMLEKEGTLAQYEKKRKEFWGQCVFQLVPPSDGFPLFYRSAFGGMPYDFRAQWLKEVEDIIGAKLLERAWTMMLGRELVEYADGLDARLRPWAQKAAVLDVENVSEAKPPEPREKTNPKFQAHILFSTIRYCRFWGSRGHGIEPNY